MASAQGKGSIAVVDPVLKLAIAEGADAEVLWRIRGTEVWDTLPEETRAARLIEIYREFDRSIKKPGFPLRAAEQTTLDDLGVLGLAMKTAPDLLSAWQRSVQYHAIWSGRKVLFLQRLEDRVRLSFPPDRPMEAWLSQNLELNVAGLVQLSREGCGQRVCPRAVYFRHERPRPSAAHHEFFGVTPTMGHAWDGLEFDAATATLPMLRADEGLSRFLIAFIESLDEAAPAAAVERASAPAAEGLREQVCRHIGDELANGVPNMDRVARRLGQSTRTLRRRLAELDLTFESLVVETRRQRAELLLAKTPYSIAEVAFLTGFSDTSALHRAFKRWTGVTPSEYRDGVASREPRPSRP